VKRGIAVLALLFAAACRRDPAAIPAVGTLERDRIELVAESDEPIVAVSVREGDVLTAGQVLMKLDERRLAAQVARASASRDQLAARLAELERGPRAERIRQARELWTERRGWDELGDLDRGRGDWAAGSLGRRDL